MSSVEKMKYLHEPNPCKNNHPSPYGPASGHTLDTGIFWRSSAAPQRQSVPFSLSIPSLVTIAISKRSRKHASELCV